jgi:hypothetical protein
MTSQKTAVLTFTAMRTPDSSSIEILIIVANYHRHLNTVLLKSYVTKYTAKRK